MPNKPTVGIAILTLNAEKHLARLLPPLLKSSLNPKILVIDSASTDGTVPNLRSKGIEVLSILRKDFNHGLTREKARKALGTDIVVFLTQDAYFINNESLEALTQPIVEKKASLSYARQLPRPGADIFEALPREFNYPAASHIRSIEEVSTWGVYTFFTSNSCAAYSQEALDEIGGFSSVLFGEDTLACALLLHKGHKIAYVAEAQVEHSHRFTLKEEFKRHFDMGISRSKLAPLLALAGPDSKRGGQFAALLFKNLATKPFYYPYACLHLGSKWLGYKLGVLSTFLNN